jgi:ABC-type branched-subunit amino acid transport system ATPase component/ABC-type branched-subunit amino acid transport system permease subunit
MRPSEQVRRLWTLAGGATVVLVAYALADRFLPGHLPAGIMLRGVVLGGLQSLVAMGLVLLYRSARIINFAQAAIGALAASIAIILVTGEHWSYYLAVPLGLVGAVATGWAIDKVVARRMTNAPRMIFTIATIGLGQLVGAAVLELPRSFGHLSSTTTFTTPFSFHFRVSPLPFTGDDLVALAVVPVAFGALFWFFQRTDTGTSIRASADSIERAQLLGIPVRRLSTITWMVAAGLSGVGAILSAPIVGQNVGVVSGPSTLLIPLAAAVLAGMESLPLTVVWSVILSVVAQASFWSYHQAPYSDVLDFVLILVALLVQRRSSGRADAALDDFGARREFRPIPAVVAHLPVVRVTRVVGTLVLLATAAILPLHLAEPRLVTMAYVAIYGIIAVSLVVLTGWGGQISLGQYALVGMGAAMTGALLVHAHSHLFLAMAGAMVVGALVASFVGLPALRIQGLYLAVTTLAFAVAVSSFVLSSAYIPWLNPSQVTPPVLFKRFDLSSPYSLYEFSLLVLVVALVCVRNLRRSWGGRTIVAVRDNPRAAASYGISPLKTRLLAFCISGALAGLAGSLIVLAQHGIPQPPTGFPPDESVNVFVMAVIGGIGTLTGGVLGAVFVRGAYFLPDVWQLVVTGGGLVVLLLVFPDGLAGIVFRIRDRVVVWVARRRGIEDPWAAEDQRPPAQTKLGLASPTAARAAVETIGLLHEHATASTAALRLAALEDLEVSRGAAASDAAPPDAGPPGGRVPLLSVSDLQVGYGQVHVLNGVSLGVAQGEVVALLGANGAGKTTTLRVAAGLLRPEGGSVQFLGTDITDWTPAQRVAAGLVTVLGGRGVFSSLTVAENLQMGAWVARHTHIDSGFAEDATGRVLELFPPLAKRLHQRAGSLSGGEQQMLAVAQALLCRPKVLMIDELSLGLAPMVVRSLIDVVRSLAASGMTVVVVEQSVNIATSVSDRAVFIERGRVRFSGPTPDLSRRPDLLRSVFLSAATKAKRRREGRPSDAQTNAVAALLAGAPMAATAGAAFGIGPGATSTAKPATGDGGGAAPEAPRPVTSVRAIGAIVPEGDAVPALSVIGVSKHFGGVAALTDVSFQVKPGEILGVIGSNGAGKTTLIDICSGFVSPDSGRVQMFGRDVTSVPPARRAGLGLGRVFQNARLFPAMTVAEVLATALDRRVPVRDALAGALSVAAVVESEVAVEMRVEQLLAEFNLGRFRDRSITELSAGTRRIVELACAVAHEPTVLLLDEPSDGIAQRETDALGEMLLGLREQTGAAMVMIEHDVPLVSSVADRLVCLHVGAVVAEGPTALVLDDPVVVGAYLGADEVVRPAAVS